MRPFLRARPRTLWETKPSTMVGNKETRSMVMLDVMDDDGKSRFF